MGESIGYVPPEFQADESFDENPREPIYDPETIKKIQARIDAKTKKHREWGKRARRITGEDLNTRVDI